MGSMWSSNTDESAQTVFKVINIDSSGVEKNSGRMEIVDYNLVFHKRGRPTTVWPLNTVRRYGYESNLFCFEVGRSSLYGQGIYAFKCKKANYLFEAIKKNMEANITMNRSNSTISDLRCQFNKSLIHPHKIEKITDQVNFNGLQYLKDFKNTNPLLSAKNHYMNIPSDDNNDHDSQDNYDTLQYEEPQYVAPQQAVSPYEITYTEIELEPCQSQRESLQTSAAEPSRYTTIDFDLTKHVSKKMLRSYDNTGTRKTRHDFDEYF